VLRHDPTGRSVCFGRGVYPCTANSRPGDVPQLAVRSQTLERIGFENDLVTFNVVEHRGSNTKKPPLIHPSVV